MAGHTSALWAAYGYFYNILTAFLWDIFLRAQSKSASGVATIFQRAFSKEAGEEYKKEGEL